MGSALVRVSGMVEDSMIGAMRRRVCIFYAVAVVFVQSSWLYAGEIMKYSGSYFCTADAVGGIMFNENTDKWESYRFRAGGEYIMNIVKHSKVTDTLDSKLKQTYTASISEHGSKSDVLNDIYFTNSGMLRKINPLINFIEDHGFLECRTLTGELRVNLANGRFLRTYTRGYVEGVDRNVDNPHIEIGTCSKIN